MMDEIKKKEVTLTLEQCREFIEASARINVFSKFVNKHDGDISREDCAEYLGFELKEDKEHDGD